jgi:uncharacterized membrane protein
METIAFVLAALALLFTHSKQKQIDALRKRVHRLEQDASTYRAAAGPAAASSAAPAQTSVAVEESEAPSGADGQPEPQPAYAAKVASESSDSVIQPAQQRADASPRQAQPKGQRAAVAFDMERAVGVHLPVWGGAIMLLIAGFFLARMAADNGFFTPTLGVLACAFGATLMLGAAVLVRWRRIANHGLIASALASAAIGTLYATSFLSSAAFGLTSLFTGFLLSAGTAALALVIAFAFGRPVLIVGLLGGYLAPFFLLADAPGELIIHLYLAALLVAGTATCARNGWWKPLTPMIVLHYLWLGGLMASQPYQTPSAITVILLLATPLAVFFLSERQQDMLKANPSAAHLSTALSQLLLVAGAAVTEFDPLYLAGAGAMAIATGAMTVLGGSLYPTFTAAVAWLVLLVLWREPDPAARLATTAVTLTAIAVPLIAALLKGQQARLLSTILCVVVAASFVSTMIDLDGWGGVRDLPYLWCVLALVFSAAAVLGGAILGRHAPDDQRDGVRGIFGAAASGYVSLAIVAVVHPDYFALAAALQVLGLSLVHHRYRVTALVHVAGGYTALYFGLLALSALTPHGYLSWSDFSNYLPGTSPWDAPIAALLLPALAFLAASTVLVRSGGWPLAKVLDGAGVLLLAWAISVLILPDLYMLDPRDTLLWSSLWGNAMLAIGLAALLSGRWLGRNGLVTSGLGLSFATLAIIGVGAVLPTYQFWPEWHVVGLPLLNVSVSGLVVPGAFALALAWSQRGDDRHGQVLRWSAAVAGGVLVLTGLLVDIRHLFHPELLQGLSGPIERYTYSGGMLAMAFTALFFGTRMNSQPLRYGSLVIMLATVAKVFLFDTGGLEGIWRVASFVAMGIALLGTSWFYGRYVFGKRRPVLGEPAE